MSNSQKFGHLARPGHPWRIFRACADALGLVAIAVLFSQPHAAAQGPLLELVTQRQVLMFEIQAAYWPLFELDAGKRTDFEAVADSAGRINSALDRFQGMFPPGTARGETAGSRARPEIWSEADEFNGAIKALKGSLVELEAVASDGDLGRYKAKFAEVSTRCVACHGFRPSSGGKFRFPSE